MQSQLSLRVRVLNADGSAKRDKSYDSGMVDGNTYMINLSAHEDVSKLIHKLICDLLAKAADEILTTLSPAADTLKWRFAGFRGRRLGWP